MLWVFGYGSLIWKPPPHAVEQRSGYVKGVLRRFAQSSLDHRGTPERPGRVVTVVQADEWHKITGVPPRDHSVEEDTVWGVAYRIAEDKEKEVWDYLEHREKNGYTAHDVQVYSLDLETKSEEVVVPKATCWIGTTDNPAFMGYEPMDRLAERIATCEGPSGSNQDYLFKLAESVRILYPLVKDDYLFDLEAKVRAIVSGTSHSITQGQAVEQDPPVINPYHKNPPNFKELGEQYNTFKPFVRYHPNGQSYINFKDPKALRELTRCLLDKDFGIKVVLPEDRLCPTVSNRLDYVCLLTDLHDYMREHSMVEPDSKLKVLDIGTGATPIYALLLASLRSNTHILGTDVDSRSLEYARQTLESNPRLKNRITLKQTEPEDKLLKAVEDDLAIGGANFTFTMCNPPFYGSDEEISIATGFKLGEAPAAPTAAQNELVTYGGEVEFVGRMIDDSVEVGEGVRWYTSLLGKASSIGPIRARLQKHDINNYFLTSIRQSRTARWIIGWSFTDIRLPHELTRTVSPSTKAFQPLPNKFTTEIRAASVFTLIQQLKDLLSEIGLGPTYNAHDTHWKRSEKHDTYFVDLRPVTHSWSRQARRKAHNPGLTRDGDVREDLNPLFEARLVVSQLAMKGHTPHTREVSPTRLPKDQRERFYAVHLIWVRGRDRAIVNTLWAYLSRKLAEPA